MNQLCIVDTGPLVAYFNCTERDHEWATIQFRLVQPPLVTCEAVLSESLFLLRKWPSAQDLLMQMVQEKLLVVPFVLQNEIDQIRHLISRYAKVPMSLADACLVRLSELFTHHKILTLDSDFHIYRRFGRQVIPLMARS